MNISVAKMLRACRHPQVGVFGDYAWPVECDYEMDFDLALGAIEAIKAGGEIGANSGFILAGLLLHGKPATVLDYGGGLGPVYFRLKMIAPDHIKHWGIVERPEVVHYGRQLETDNLHFCSQAMPADVALFSGVLQYLRNPYKALVAVVALNPDIIIMDRTPIGARDRYMVQWTWPHLGGHKLPWRVLSEARVTSVMGPRYELILDQSTDHPGPDETQAKYASRIYRRRSV